MKEAKTLKNADGKDIVIFQNGDRGMYIGRLDVELEKTKNETLLSMGIIFIHRNNTFGTNPDKFL